MIQHVVRYINLVDKNSPRFPARRFGLMPHFPDPAQPTVNTCLLRSPPKLGYIGGRGVCVGKGEMGGCL